MNRTITIYGVLLCAALVASYFSWTAEDTGEPAEGVVLVAAEVDDVEGISWSSEKLQVELEVRSDTHGEYLWVDLVEIKEKPAPRTDPADVIDGTDEGAADEDGPDVHGPDDGHDHGDDDAAHADPEEDEPVEEPEPEMIKEEKRQSFMAGEAGRKLLAKLAPLTAQRLIEVTGDKAAEFGLDEPKATLTIRRRGKPERVLEIGGEAYGVKDRYVRDLESGKVYLVDDQTFKPLQYAKSRLPERELSPLDEEDITTVTVTDGASKVTLEHENRDDREAQYWALEGETESNETAEAWLDKVFRLRSAGYVQAEDMPTGLETAFVMTATGEDGTTTSITVSMGSNPDGKETWYARSDHTRELVKLHKVLASEAAEDLATVFSADEGAEDVGEALAPAVPE